jgi:circadian clock protein KaiC
LQRLFRWLKDRGVTTLITAERGDGTLTRQGLEEYVSDCVVLLDHRVDNQISTRRLRIVKYRGSVHGTNEYPFLIDEDGINVVPITSLGLAHGVSEERVSTGVPRLDTMLGGEGVYRGSTVLVSGTAGAGKSSMSAHFVRAACERGERVLYFAFEESPNQIVRNMRSIGVDLGKYVKSGLLRFMASRPMMYGMEMHLAVMHKAIREYKPTAVVVDPISSLLNAGDSDEARALMVRLIDFLKAHGVTAYMTSLTGGGADLEKTSTEISSIVDTWLLVKSIEIGGERNRGMYVLKSRGMAHSNQIREFLLTDRGVELVDVYTGAEGVLTGAARAAREAQEVAAVLQKEQETQRRRRELQRKREALELKIAALRAELEAEQMESDILTDEDESRASRLVADRVAMARKRFADVGVASGADKARKNGHGGAK